MKKYIFGAILSIGILISPAYAQAAGLTTDQAAVLINVVKASPSTPASAFVDLITAFSGVTVNQAASLITVIQSSPATPASVFVPLLTSFTTDTSATQPTTTVHLSVTSIVGSRVTVSYTNLPVHAYINLLWKNENGQYEAGAQAQIPNGGTGTVVIQQNTNAPSGYYIAEARNTDDMYWRVGSSSFVYGSTASALNCNLSASPSSLASGQSVILSWTSLGATKASWKQDAAVNLLGLPYGNLATDGSQTFTVSGKAGSVAPTLNVYRDDGLSGACSTTITVNALQTVANPVINTFSASPTSVVSGGSSTLSWSASNTAQCGISVISSGAPGIDLTKATSNYSSGVTSVTTGALTQSATYELRCAPLTGATGGYAIQQVTVVVMPAKVAVVGVYQGTYPSGVSSGYMYHPEGTVNVKVAGDTPLAPSPTILVLTSYEPENWIIDTSAGSAKIQKVIAMGYYNQRVTGLDSSIPIEYHSLQTDGVYKYSYQYGDANYTNLMSWLSAQGLPTANSFSGSYTGSTFSVYVGDKG